MNGDVLTALNYAELMDAHRQAGNMLTIASHRRVVSTDYGVLHLGDSDSNGDGEATMQNVVGFEEKPQIPYVVSMGVYVLEPRALELIERGERLDLPDLVLRLLAAGEQVGSYLYDGYWLDIGRHDDYEKAIVEFEQLRPMFMNEDPGPAPTAGVSAAPPGS
jgi:NDP-sugar pyrophosphorylase family protein